MRSKLILGGAIALLIHSGADAQQSFASRPVPDFLRADAQAEPARGTEPGRRLGLIRQSSHTKGVALVRLPDAIFRHRRFALRVNPQGRLVPGESGTLVEVRATRVGPISDTEGAWDGAVYAPGDSTRIGYVSIIRRTDGAFYGSVLLPGQRYQIVPLSNGQHALQEVDENSFADSESGTGSDVTNPSPPPPSYQAASAEDTSVPAGRCTFDVQRVLVVYTSGAANSSTAGISADISSLINTSNSVYGNSRIFGLRLELVHSENVEFSTSSLVLPSLQDLVGSQYVSSLRDQHRADMVIGIDDEFEDASGRATGFGGDAAQAYAVAALAPSISRYTFTHELGHLQGAAHDPGHTDTSRYADGFGHRWDADCFLFWCNNHHATVMAYTDGGYQRGPHFSNPNVNYGAKPTGTSSRNNARALRSTRSEVADYRDPAGFEVQAFASPGAVEGEFVLESAPCGQTTGAVSYAWQLSDPYQPGYGPVVSTSPSHPIFLSEGETVFVRLTATLADGTHRVAYTSAYRPEALPCSPTQPCNRESETPGLSANTGWTVGPNPSQGLVMLRSTSWAGEHVEVEVFDVLGRSVMPSAIYTPISGQVQLDLKSLPNGLYTVRIGRGAQRQSALVRVVH